MKRLTNNKWENRLLQELPALYATSGFEEMAQAATSLITELIPVRFCDATFFRPQPGGELEVLTFHAGPGSWTEAQLQEWSLLQSEFAHLNPFAEIPVPQLAERVVRGSEIVADSWFQRCALGAEVFAPMDASRQLILSVAVPGGLFAFTANRGGKDFDDKEHAMMEFFRPHMSKLVHERVTACETSQALSALQTAADGTALGIVTLDGESLKVGKINAVAERVLRSLDLSVQGGRLPEALSRWLGAQRDPFRWAAGKTPEWLIVRREDSEAEIRFVENPVTAEVYLLIVERKPYRQAARLLAFGLTPREAETLHWVAEGKSSREIAIILGCSPHTVDKHAEHILAKLGVESRKAAAARVRDLDLGQ